MTARQAQPTEGNRGPRALLQGFNHSVASAHNEEVIMLILRAFEQDPALLSLFALAGGLGLIAFALALPF